MVDFANKGDRYMEPSIAFQKWILANKNVRTVMTCLVLKKLSENVGMVIIIKNFRCRDLNPGLSGESRVS